MPIQNKLDVILIIRLKSYFKSYNPGALYTDIHVAIRLLVSEKKCTRNQRLILCTCSFHYNGNVNCRLLS